MPGAVLGLARRVPIAGKATVLALSLSAPGVQAAVTVVDTGQAQCCSSINPDAPPATNYGATMQRSDDPLAMISDSRPVIVADPVASSRELEELVDRLEGEHGVMAAELVEPLSDLATAYIAEKRIRYAIKTLRRGIHVARMNGGLHTPDQIGMLEQLIDVHLQRNDFMAADAQQTYLYRVLSYRKNHNSPELRAATLRYANWMRGAYLGDLGRERYPRLVGLNDLYENAMREIEEAQGPDSRELIPYLEGRAQLSYLISVYPGEVDTGFRMGATGPGTFDLSDQAQLRFWRMQDHNFRYGLQALRKRQEIIESDKDSSDQEKAESLVAIADWYQWHRRYAPAINHYEEAWSVADDSAETKEWLQSTFADPLELPRDTVFSPGAVPLGTLNDAVVQMRFDVSRHGEAKDIKILSEETRDTQAGITRAYHYLRNLRFRPRLREGEVVRAEDIERSYFIRY